MAWKRFPVPEFDYGPLKGLDFVQPEPVSAEEETRIVAAAQSGDASVVGAYAVSPNPGLIDKLAFEGDYKQMILCVLPQNGAHVLGRSMAWFNQRVHILNENSADAEPVLTWKTPRTHNTRLGPEDGVDLDLPYFYLLSGRITTESSIGNRVMIDDDWSPESGQGYRVICASDNGEPNFHDSCIMVSWAA